MARYHIKKDGTPGVCHAKEGNCPLGGVNDHYPNQESAQAAADKLSAQTFSQSYSAPEPDTSTPKFNFAKTNDTEIENVDDIDDRVDLENPIKISNATYNAVQVSFGQNGSPHLTLLKDKDNLAAGRLELSPNQGNNDLPENKTQIDRKKLGEDYEKIVSGLVDEGYLDKRESSRLDEQPIYDMSGEMDNLKDYYDISDDTYSEYKMQYNKGSVDSDTRERIEDPEGYQDQLNKTWKKEKQDEIDEYNKSRL